MYNPILLHGNSLLTPTLLQHICIYAPILLQERYYFTPILCFFHYLCPYYKLLRTCLKEML
nr:MAG TPA: hypothetical protein [Bacteriophage sp.]